MIKLVFCMRRKPGLSLEEFQRTWLEDHAPIVKEHAKALGVLRYVQLHSDLGPVSEALGRVRGAPAPYDGVAELWYESIEDLQASFETKEGRAAGRALLEDEKRFIDLANSPVWIGEEHVVVG